MLLACKLGRASHRVFTITTLRFAVTADGTNPTVVTWGDFTPYLNNWTYIIARYDNTRHKIGISVNNGAFVEQDFTGPISNGSYNFEVGNARFQSNYNGQMDSLYLAKRLSTDAERTSLYNSGSGRVYNDLTSGNSLDTFKTNLVSWWDLNEESGTRFDSVGTNHLTAAGAKLIQPSVLGNELIQNTGFETVGANPPAAANWSEWVSDGAVARTTTAGEFKSGTAALKVTAGPTLTTYVYQVFSVVSGQSYQWTFWTRGDGTNTGNYQVYDVTNSASIIGRTSTGNASTTFSLKTVSLTAPAGCTSIRIYFYSSTTNGGIAYFDDVSMKQITTAGLNNSGFETAGAGGADIFGSWTEGVSGTGVISDETDPTNIYYGAHACKFTTDGASNLTQLQQNIVTVGRKYKATVYAKSPNGGVMVISNAAGGNYLLQTLTNSFVLYTTYFTQVTNTAFQIYSASSSSVVYLDSVTLESLGPMSAAGIAANSSQDANFAAQFNGTSQSLTVSNPASLQVGDIDFEVGGWFYLDSKNNFQYLASKYTTVSDGEYFLAYSNSADRFMFYVINSSSGVGTATADALGSPQAGSWYFIRGWHDSVNNKVRIQVNNGTINETDWTTGVRSGSNDFAVGARSDRGAGLLAGRADNVYVAKRILTPTEATFLFNSGKGRQYSELAGTSLSNNITLISGDTLNGNFETTGTGGFASWTESASGSSTVNVDTTSTHAGSRALRLDVDSSNSSAYVYQDKLVAGRRYKVSFWAKSSVSGRTVYTASSGGGNASFTLTDQYAQYTGYITAASTTLMVARGTGTSASIYIDDIVVEEVPLISYWDFDNKSNLGTDSVTSSANNLTNNNTATQGIGTGYYDGAVSKWQDQSASNLTFTQTAQSKRPAYDSTGINNTPALRFDGEPTNTAIADSLVKTGDQIGAGDVTVFSVIKASGWGGNSFGQIINNGKIWYGVSNAGRIEMSSESDFTPSITSANGSITLNTSYVVTLTRAASGTTNIYINGSLSGGADQSSGVPSSGSDTYIGNRAAGDRTFDGWIGDTMIFNSVLSSVDRYSIENSLSAKYGIALSSVKNPTPANEGTFYPTDAPALVPNIAQGYSTLQSFSETLGSSSSGSLKYQISPDNGSTWYWWNGSAWVATTAGVGESNDAATINTNITNFSAGSSPKRLKWKAYFISDGTQKPRLDNIAMTYIWDTTPPANPTVSAFESATSSETVISGQWYHYPHPRFTWVAPADAAGTNEEVSGIAGYYVYFGEDATANPVIAGSFQPGVTYTVPEETTLTSGHTYYLKIRTKDNAGNITDATDPFVYHFDTGTPPAPEYINVSPVGCSTSKEFSFTFPAATDTESGINSYEYKLGSTGKEDRAHQSVTTPAISNIRGYQDGDNVIYIRSWDNANNASNWQTAVFCATNVVAVTDGPTVEAGPSSMTVKWKSNKPTTSYVRVFEGNDYVSEQGQVAYTTDHTVRIVGLKSEAAYRYKLVWSDQSGNVGESDDWHTTQTATSPQISELHYEVLSPTKASVSWKTNYTASAKIEYGVGSYAKSDTLNVQGTEFSAIIDNLTPGDNYQFRVKASTGDNSEFVAGDIFSTPALPKVSDIAFDYLSSAATSVRATWKTNVETTSIVSYKQKDSSEWKQISDATMTKDHSLEIKDLQDNTDYDIVAKGADRYQNTTTSDTQHYSTPFDTRPPKVKNLTIEVKATGFGTTQKAQLVATWETDEPASSQLEYAPGISGVEYSNTTKEDQTLSTSHVVIASELDPSKIYHLRAVSKDRAGNKGTSEDTTVITGKVQQSVIDIIMNSLERSLGWIFMVFR